MIGKVFLLVLNLIGIFTSSFVMSRNSIEKDNLEEIKIFFSENLETFKNEYYKQFNEEFTANNVIMVKKVYSFSDEYIGHIVFFDIGYIAYGFKNELFCISKTKYNTNILNEEIYVNSKKIFTKYNNNFFDLEGNLYLLEEKGTGQFSDEICHPLINEYQNRDFKINSCITKIPFFKDKFDSSNWGDYTIVSCEQGKTTDCGVIAIMNLLYSYKLSDVVDFTKNKTPTEMKEELRVLTNWKGNIVGEGMLPFDMVRGCCQYIDNENYYLNASATPDDEIFGIGLYSNFKIHKTAHFALIVGSAEQYYFWIFKTYWDIVVSWKPNVADDKIPESIENVSSCYHVIDKQYLVSRYYLYDLNMEIVK